MVPWGLHASDVIDNLIKAYIMGALDIVRPMETIGGRRPRHAHNTNIFDEKVTYNIDELE